MGTARDKRVTHGNPGNGVGIHMPNMESISIEGAVVVNMTGEEIILSENKVKHLRRVPKYFFLMQKGIHLLPDGVLPSEAQVGLHG